MMRLPKLLVCILGLMVIVGGTFFFWAISVIYSARSVEVGKVHFPEPTLVFSRNGELIAEFFERRVNFVPLDEIPEHVVNAFIAAEDAEFFKHRGINVKGIIRAAIKNLMSFGFVQGGSSITQQVVRTLYLSMEKTLRRKVKEIYLALKMESTLPKEEILELFLNSIYLGNSSWGVEEASKNYFRKGVRDLSLAEAVLIAGIMKSPGKYSPIKYPKRARARQSYVLRRMLEEGFISRTEYEKALSEVFYIYPARENPYFSENFWFAEHVRRWLVEKFGRERTYGGGLRVWTLMDIECQKAAQKALKIGIDRVELINGGKPKLDVSHELKVSYLVFPYGFKVWEGEKDELKAKVVKVGRNRVIIEVDSTKGEIREDFFKSGLVRDYLEESIVVRPCGDGKFCPIPSERKLEGAILVMNTEGDVLCMIGGYDWRESQFIRAVQASRQPGSAFKPIVYTVALEAGYTPSVLVKDSPFIVVEEDGIVWSPKNFNMNFSGFVTLFDALAKSINNATVRIANEIGIARIHRMARRLEIMSPLADDLTVALGSSSVSLLEMVKAYNVFASGGYLVEPIFVERVEGPNGEVLFRAERRKKKVLRSDIAFVMTWILRNAILRGTGWRAKALKIPIAGKTGTTDEGKDAWFIGFTRDVVVGVWVGRDDFKPIGGRISSGPSIAVPILVDFMKSVPKFLNAAPFEPPPGVEFAKVDPRTGLLVSPGSDTYVVMAYIAGTSPSDYAEELGSDELLKEF